MKKKKEKWIDSLGNLTLLSRRKNIQAQNYSFEEKKKVYTQSDNVASSFEITRKLFEHDTWTMKELKERNSNLQSFIGEKLDIFKN